MQVGAGSVALHATLTAVAQAADEIPMLLFSLFMLAALLELHVPSGITRLASSRTKHCVY